MFAEVVFAIPVSRGFDYAVPQNLAPMIQPGQRVLAPFGKKGMQIGMVLRVYHKFEGSFPVSALKPIAKIIDQDPVVSQRDFDLAQWISKRYFCSFGEAVFTVLPVGKQLPPKRDKVVPPPPPPAAPPDELILTPDQTSACHKILPAVSQGVYHAFLLQGPAAAGKTEVYARAISETLKHSRSAVFLVPEICLTPQMQNVLKSRFGEFVEVWHSQISRNARWRIWQKTLKGECRVLLGPRSAVFAPMPHLGLIVVDEEHDTSYKQDSTPHYHTRALAMEKAKSHNAVVIFGSATPSMEIYKKALDGELTLVEMKQRVLNQVFPRLTLVDMRENKGWYMSDKMVQSLKEGLEKEEQSIIFLNRRGFATYLLCQECGWEARCPKCEVSLVYHKKDNSYDSQEKKQPEKDLLRCHYCSYKRKLPDKCPSCQKPTIKIRGLGTQKIFSDMSLLFPKARLLRWDRDTTQSRHAHHQAYDSVKSESVDIVIGTQMIAQGMDFPCVTLVNVIDADRTLRFPDFRAGERTFQLITQVSGRAGRAHIPGSVLIQTRNPGHYALQAAVSCDYQSFAEQELSFRKEMDYPPFVRMIHVLLRSRKPETAEKAGEELMTWLENHSLPDAVSLLGPAPSFYKQRKGFIQWQVIIKTPDRHLEKILHTLHQYHPPKYMRLAVDVDPEEMV